MFAPAPRSGSPLGAGRRRVPCGANVLHAGRADGGPDGPGTGVFARERSGARTQSECSMPSRPAGGAPGCAGRPVSRRTYSTRQAWGGAWRRRRGRGGTSVRLARLHLARLHHRCVRCEGRTAPAVSGASSPRRAADRASSGPRGRAGAAIEPGRGAPCHYPPAGGGVRRETGSDRRQKRPSGQSRQGNRRTVSSCGFRDGLVRAQLRGRRDRPRWCWRAATRGRTRPNTRASTASSSAPWRNPRCAGQPPGERETASRVGGPRPVSMPAYMGPFRERGARSGYPPGRRLATGPMRRDRVARRH